MGEVNKNFLYTIVQRLVLRIPAKNMIAPIMFSNIQTSTYRLCQVSVPVNLNLFQNLMKQALNSSRRQHITFHITEGGQLIFPYSLSKATKLSNHIRILIPDEVTFTKGRRCIMLLSSVLILPITATNT